MIIPGQKPSEILDQKHWSVQNEERVQIHFQMYLSEFNIRTRDSLTDNDPYSKKEFVFLGIVRDYVNFHISFDMFCALLGLVWITNESKFDFHKQTKIERMCFTGPELQWYMRNNPESGASWLTEILEYYKKNKNKIEK